MNESKIPSLGFVLLGLLQQKASSGYDLRKALSSTAMKTYSDSPGAIYPALRRLEKHGLIRGSAENRAGSRRRRVFRMTRKGLAALKKWIALPVTQEDLVRGQQEIMLRFALSEPTAGPAAALALLRSLQNVLKAYIPVLQDQLNSTRSILPTSGRLAFEYGIQGYKALLEWSRFAAASYERGKEGTS